jgi:hypothetical protein
MKVGKNADYMNGQHSGTSGTTGTMGMSVHDLVERAFSMGRASSGRPSDGGSGHSGTGAEFTNHARLTTDGDFIGQAIQIIDNFWTSWPKDEYDENGKQLWGRRRVRRVAGAWVWSAKTYMIIDHAWVWSNPGWTRTETAKIITIKGWTWRNANKTGGWKGEQA